MTPMWARPVMVLFGIGSSSPDGQAFSGCGRAAVVSDHTTKQADAIATDLDVAKTPV